jgi:hypothetical protein
MVTPIQCSSPILTGSTCTIIAASRFAQGEHIRPLTERQKFPVTGRLVRLIAL